MGADSFIVRERGRDADHAFQGAIDEARARSGGGGYTGTIAEKHDFVLIPLPAGEDAAAYATRLLDEEDSRVNDNWGPAGCIALGEGEWLFFGWASC